MTFTSSPASGGAGIGSVDGVVPAVRPAFGQEDWPDPQRPVVPLPAFLVRFFVRGLMHTERYKDGIGAQCRVDDLHDCGVHAYAICDR